jgi:hypothetical protein
MWQGLVQRRHNLSFMKLDFGTEFVFNIRNLFGECLDVHTD